MIANTLDPVWDAPLVVPLAATSPSGVRLVLCLKDYDVGAAADSLGAASIALDNIPVGPSGRIAADFDLPVRLNGVEHGRVAGRIELIPSVG